jgi:hypothetical protein
MTMMVRARRNLNLFSVGFSVSFSVVALTLFLPGCHRTPPATTAGAPVAACAEAAPVRDELYFGMGRGEQDTIPTAEWTRFLATEITPRFPAGLSVLEAYGQWMQDAGAVVREPTRIVILIHPDCTEADTAINRIIDRYKARFEQQSVLRVTAPVRARF